jgi:hypothetical protein
MSDAFSRSSARGACFTVVLPRGAPGNTRHLGLIALAIWWEQSILGYGNPQNDTN